jgi:hypothetical protein
LFWKKKNKAEALVSLDSHDARSSFRVCPPLTEPIRITFCSKSIALIDIGASGIAFQNDGFSEGDTDQIQLTLPTEKSAISVTVEIISIDTRGICHCQFLELAEHDQNAIHRYMLALQIREARKKRRSLGRFREHQAATSTSDLQKRSFKGPSVEQGGQNPSQAMSPHANSPASDTT